MSKESIYILYPSHTPKYLTTFPVNFDSENWIKGSNNINLLALTDKQTVHLVNPPEKLLKAAIDSQELIFIYFDYIPCQQTLISLKKFKNIYVPSIFLKRSFIKKGVLVSQMDPVHKETAQANTPSVKRSKRATLWIDEQLVLPKYRLPLMSILEKYHSSLRILWLTKKKYKKNTLTFIHPHKESPNISYLNSDFIVTLMSKEYSLTPIHLKCLSSGVSVITLERGDHDEWVNHNLTGFILNPKRFTEDLHFYLKQIIRNKNQVDQMKINAKLLTTKWLRERNNGGETNS